MSEDDGDRFDRLFEAFDAKPRDENPDFQNVDVEISDAILAKIEGKHGLCAEDVEDVIKGQPPVVEEVPHPDDDEKRLFSGVTRHGREAFVVGVWAPSPFDGRRRLRIVTAFLPDDDDYFAKVRR